MHSFSVIEYFNVGKEALAEIVLNPVLGPINSLGFQGFEKCLCHGIVVTVTLTAHTLNHLVFFQSFVEGFTGILYPSVRVENHSCRWLPMQYSHIQSNVHGAFFRQMNVNSNMV